MQSPGKSKQEEQWGCVRKDVQCPKGRPGLPEPGPGTFIPNTPLPFPAGALPSGTRGWRWVQSGVPTWTGLG